MDEDVAYTGGDEVGILARVTRDHNGAVWRFDGVAERVRHVTVSSGECGDGDVGVLIDNARFDFVRVDRDSLSSRLALRADVEIRCQAANTCCVISTMPFGPYTRSVLRPITHGVRIRSGYPTV